MEFSPYISQVRGWIPNNKLKKETLKHLIYLNINDKLKDQLANIIEESEKLNK